MSLSNRGNGQVTGAFFFSAVILREKGLDIEKDFQSIPAETGALIALLERGEVEANAKARTLRPEDFFDNSFLRELENSGFVENLYR